MAILRSSLSAIIRGKKPDPGPRGLSGIVRGSQEVTAPGSSSASELEAVAQNLHEFQQALVESIYERNTVLEQERDAIAAKFRDLTSELESTKQFLAQLEHDNERLRTAASTTTKESHAAENIEGEGQEPTRVKAVEMHLPAEEGVAGKVPNTAGLPETVRQNNTILRKNIGLVGWQSLPQRSLEAERKPSILTPRRMIVEKMISDASQDKTQIAQPESGSFTQRVRSIEGLTNKELDFPLGIKEAECFYSLISTGDFELPTCQLCKIPKLASEKSTIRVDEFARPPVSDPCCGAIICKKCYLKEVTRSLKDHWWSKDIYATSWMICPSPRCLSLLPIFDGGNLRNLLEQLEDSEISRHLALYGRLLGLRNKVGDLWRDHIPTAKELNSTSALHNQLIDTGLIDNPLSAATTTEPTTSIEARLIDIDFSDYTVRIPLFTSFFRRKVAPIECSFCAEDFYEINFGSVDAWVESCRGFRGDWMWEVLQFPFRLGVACNHEIDFCTGCLGRHVQARLEEHGRSRCDQIACPSGGCKRLLTYDEIRLYTSESTFAIYDQYLNVNALSQFPNFRWCLRPGCENGQLYDLEDGNVPWGGPLVRCEECAFNMCYTHSVPWHKGQTCKQYSSDQGDPSSQLSREWITGNTKKCPKCKVDIEKGNNCFHMTCYCQFEFCWICLADWKLIRPEAGEYRKNAHQVGCFFRTSDLRPTQLSGTTIQAALDQRRQDEE